MSWISKWFGARGGLHPKGGAVGDADRPPVAPPRVQIDSQTYEVYDLSLRILRINPYEGTLIPHQHFEFRLFFELDGEPFDFVSRGWVRSITQKDGLIANFARPQPFYQKLLGEYLMDWRRQRGARP